MIIKNCMKKRVFSVHEDTPIGDAVHEFLDKRVGTLPVVDQANRLVGVLQLRDVLELVMPDFVRLMENFDFVLDFGAVEARLPTTEMVNQPVRTVMQPAVSVKEDCGLLRAFSILHSHHLLDLPVVNEQGELVGLASRVDIGVTLLARWYTVD